MVSPLCLRVPRHQWYQRGESTAATTEAMDGRSLGAKAKYHRASGAPKDWKTPGSTNIAGWKTGATD